MGAGFSCELPVIGTTNQRCCMRAPNGILFFSLNQYTTLSDGRVDFTSAKALGSDREV